MPSPPSPPPPHLDRQQTCSMLSKEKEERGYGSGATPTRTTEKHGKVNVMDGWKEQWTKQVGQNVHHTHTAKGKATTGRSYYCMYVVCMTAMTSNKIGAQLAHKTTTFSAPPRHASQRTTRNPPLHTKTNTSQHKPHASAWQLLLAPLLLDSESWP